MAVAVMTLKEELETWVEALQAYDREDWQEAIELFSKMGDQARIIFNIGIIFAAKAHHETAIQVFALATSKDPFFAVAFFQRGVSNFLLGQYEEAVQDFDNAFANLRQNLTVDYEQLGLKFRLYSCEVLFNRGLALIYAGQEDQGMVDLVAAKGEKQSPKHDVIDEALDAGGDGYTVFSIPVGVVYRPAENKIKNLPTKNYLGQAKLIAATDATENFVGFSGSERQRLERSASTSEPVKSTSQGVKLGGGSSLGSSLGSTLGSSLGPSSGGTIKAPGLARRGTAAARLEQTPRNESAGNDLRSLLSQPQSQSQQSLTSTGAGRFRSSSVAPGRQMQQQQNRTEPPIDRNPSRYQPPSQAQEVYDDDIVDDYGDEEDDEYEDTMPPTVTPRLNDRFNDWARSNMNGGNNKPNRGMGMGNGPNSSQAQAATTAGRNRSNTLPVTPKSGGFSRSQGGGFVGYTGPNDAYNDNGMIPPSARGMTPTGGGGGGFARSQSLNGGGFGYYGGQNEMQQGEYGGGGMTGMRVVFHLNGSKRGMLMDPRTPLDQFMTRIRGRFKLSGEMIPMQYKDDDGHLVSILDDDDWESAVETARAQTLGGGGRGEGKLEIWIDDSSSTAAQPQPQPPPARQQQQRFGGNARGAQQTYQEDWDQ